MSLHPRVERSRRAFEDAALAAAGPDGENLTVTALCSASGLNRATFYLHYQDLDDLLASTVERLAGEAALRWRENVEGAPASELVARSKSAFGDYLEHVDARRDFYRWALVTRGSHRSVTAATTAYFAAVTSGLSVAPGNSLDDRSLRRRSAYLAGAMLGVLTQWVADDDPEPPRKLRDWLWSALTAREVEAMAPANE